MPIIQVQSARKFRHIRAATFGVGLFLRVAWGYIIALNTFSKTTNTEPAHRAISAYLFAIDILAVSTASFVAAVEMWRSKWAWWSHVSFELGWLTLFLVFELIGAITFTIIEPTFRCDYGFVNVLEFPKGNAVSLGDLRKRATSSEDLVEPTCNLFNILALAFVWVVLALSLFYTLYFALLAKTASSRNPDVWHSRVAKFDWSITSADCVDPRSLKRPGNPQMEKLSEKSTPTDRYFEPNFVNPFSDAPIDDFAPQFAIVNPPRPHGQALGRHQLMSHYAYEAETPTGQKRHSRGTRRAGSLTSNGSTFEDFDARQLAAMRLEGRAPGQRKNRPQLRIKIPPPSKPISRVSISDDVRIKSQVGHEQGRMPFQDSFSSEGGRAATPRSAGSAVAPSNPVPDPSLVPSIPPLHISFLNQGLSPKEVRGLALQSVHAPHRYPDIVQSPNRKSTNIVSGSIYAAEPRPLIPPAPSGAVLPMHSGDLHKSRPRRVPVPTLSPAGSATSKTHQTQVRRVQTEKQLKMHGPRPLSGPAHNRSSSNQTWPPHPRQGRHVPTGSAGSISSNSTSTGPRGPWAPPGLSSRSNPQNRPESASDPRMPPRGWHYPSSRVPPSMPSVSASSSSTPANHIRYPSLPPPVAWKASRTTAGTRDQAFGTPSSSDHLSSSYESAQAIWQGLDEKYRLEYEMDDKRSSRGKLRKPNPQVFKDTL